MKIIGNLIMVMIAMGLAACVWMPCPQKGRAFHIDHINDSGAFRGIVEGRYVRQGDSLKINVDRWRVRFGVGDQPDRHLSALYFEIGVQGPNGWSRNIKSNRLEMNRIVRADQDVELNNLEFTIAVDPTIWTQKIWLVAAYESPSSTGQAGFNFGHDSTYLFTTQAVVFGGTAE